MSVLTFSRHVSFCGIYLSVLANLEIYLFLVSVADDLPMCLLSVAIIASRIFIIIPMVILQHLSHIYLSLLEEKKDEGGRVSYY